MLQFKVGNATVLNLIKGSYELSLNGIRTFEIMADGADSALLAEYDVDKAVNIHRDSTLELTGKVEAIQNLQGGAVVMHGSGQELDFVDTKVTPDSGKQTKLWTSTNDTVIFAALVAMVSGWSSNVGSATPLSVTFRAGQSESVWDAIIRLLQHGNKDIGIDDASKTLFLKDRQGSSASVAQYIEGQNIGSVTRIKRRAAASKVIVYGKGDGQNGQIVGTAGSGTPVVELYDRNIVTTAEANNRASKELSVIQNQVKNHEFRPYKTTDILAVGDRVTLTANSIGLHSEALDILSINRSILGTTEMLELEVGSPSYRIASRSVEAARAASEARAIVSNSTLQGGPNLLSFGHAINAKSGNPARFAFELAAADIQDEAGTIRVSRFRLDYDIDPFRREYDTAGSYGGSDPDIKNSSANTAPGVSGSVADDGPTSVVDDANGSDSTHDNYTANTWTDLSGGNVTPDSSNTQGEHVHVCFGMTHSGSGSFTVVRVRIIRATNSGFTTGIVYFPREEGIRIIKPVQSGTNTQELPVSCHIFIPENTGPNFYKVQIYPETNNWSAQQQTTWYTLSQHDHADGTLSTDSHLHSDGTYVVDKNTISGITIGDDVSDAAALSATSCTIKVDHWNGSIWVNKLTLSSQPVTPQQDVDLSSSGTLPDATGLWRVTIEPNGVSPDLVQAIVRVKHQIEN